MREHRHAHPHVDSRQPRNNSYPGTNPPVFVWKSQYNKDLFTLRVAKDQGFTQLVFEIQTSDPMYLPNKSFEIGKYYWQWFYKQQSSEIFEFTITEKSVNLPIPFVENWDLESKHPKIYFDHKNIDKLKSQKSSKDNIEIQMVLDESAIYINESHQISEPPYLENAAKDYKKFFEAWYDITLRSRKFVAEAEVLALRYLITGEKEFGRAACERMLSLTKWDPYGSTHFKNNAEAHMSVIWNGSKVVDWVFDLFTEEEKLKVIEQFKHRGLITYEILHSKDIYGSTKFDSHSGRQIVFLGMLSMVFYKEISEAKEWLTFLRPVLCGVWPVWGGDEGGWAQGPAYATYVYMMTMFATALKAKTNADLYKRPFWENHAGWRLWCWPAYVEWLGFGDSSEKYLPAWHENLKLIRLISMQRGTNAFLTYQKHLEEELPNCTVPDNRRMPYVDSQLLLLSLEKNDLKNTNQIINQQLRVFNDIGWAAVRSNINESKEDTAMIFRSSPYGSISHSHANNNDFILHVGGKAILTPAGYYDGYGSPHHYHHNKQTKSHNCITLSGAGQIIESEDSVGSIEQQYEDENIAYFCGIADKSYSDRALICRRHIIYQKKKKYYVMADEFVARPDNLSALEFNIHSWGQFTVNDDNKTFEVNRDGCGIKGYFMFHFNSFFSLTNGWDPAPKDQDDGRAEYWKMQYNLKFTTCGFNKQRLLCTIFDPFHSKLKSKEIQTYREGEGELANIAGDILISNQLFNQPITVAGINTNALVTLKTDQIIYFVTKNGITKK